MIALALALGLTIVLHKGDIFQPPKPPDTRFWEHPGAGGGARCRSRLLPLERATSHLLLPMETDYEKAAKAALFGIEKKWLKRR